MTPHAAEFLAAVSLFLFSSLFTAGVYLRRYRRRCSDGAVETLLKRLVEVDRHKLALVAAELTRPEDGDHPQPELERWQVWELTGGMAGMEALRANADVLIDLASYVQQWYPQALPVAEQLRLNAREIQWHVERLQGAERRGRLDATFADYAQRAAAIYYGMTQHVLTLFEVTQTPGLARLRSAL